jgi:hypothetical protein
MAMAKEKKPEENIFLSKESMDWFGGWMSGGLSITNLPRDIEKELKQYRPIGKGTLTLYRGLQPSDVLETKEGDLYITFNFLSSWTYDREMAFNFSDKVIKTTIEYSSILIDTTQLDPKYIRRQLGGFPDEKEVILYSGIYKCKNYH